MKLTDPREIAKVTREAVAVALTQFASSRGLLETGASEVSVAPEPRAGTEPLAGFKTGADESPFAGETPASDHPRALAVESYARLGADIGLRLRNGFLDRVETFAAALALWGAKLNLTSAPDDPAEIAFHILDSMAPLIFGRRGLAGGAFRTGSKVLDLGSGAGFPALILAAASDADFALLEARRKRASFLGLTAAEMGLSNAQVNSSHSDSFQLKPVFDVVTARAFAEPAVVFDTARAALKPGGHVILYASPAQRATIDLAATHSFEPSVFIEYEVPRGATLVAHILATARRIA
jgi:16S rRNA (guanine527-N7)-methyltransferase